MELVFNKVQSTWVAEFEATADFNLHLEGVKRGDIMVYQRGSATGQYAQVNDVKADSSYTTYDCDYTALVYPKYIKVSCRTQPSMGVVTFAQ